MKLKFFSVIVLVLLTLVGCSYISNDNQANNSIEPVSVDSLMVSDSGTNNVEMASEGEFIYRLVVEKSEYTHGEPVNATIDYNPAKVLLDSVFDLEFFEDDRIFTWRNAKIIDIKIADETFDLDKGVVAGMQMDYVIYFDSSDDKFKQNALYVNKKDTRVFKIVNDATDQFKQLISLEDLKSAKRLKFNISSLLPLSFWQLKLMSTNIH